MTSGQTNSIYCAHCGTGNKLYASICDRCGERVYRPNVDQPPPLALRPAASATKPTKPTRSIASTVATRWNRPSGSHRKGLRRQAGPQNSLRRLAESQSRIRLRLSAERRSRGPALSPRNQSDRSRVCRIRPALLPKTGLGFAAPNCQNR